MIEKYKNDELHFLIRLIVFLIVVLGFVMFSFLFINPNGRSCLGPPRLLPFMFIGFPLLIVLSFVDIIMLAFLKALNWEKFLINIGFLLSVVLFAVGFIS